ncbi:putative ssDNA-binding transcriptional regulator [Pectobacterium phage DU_PP_V]|uniref:Putative ssDNA-binding transcriptional regulator n=1 Tax=Pectobacterium phage DU_PP_V TaxID=2041492 RepID=A0A2D2W771_9CAUD|nr:transcriptional regulator [Pectobacterium phage DU_PP_V]ATS94073.1 putative ssDNA-binding transcriptional regulator [Pectobacterium phage DU_PP_V]
MEVNQDYSGHEDDQSFVIFEREGTEIRLTVSEFRDNLYLGFRLWLQDINGDWFPTKSGFSFPYSIETTSRIFRAFTKILSESEVLHEVSERAKEKAEE